MAVVAPNEPLCQSNVKRFEVISQTRVTCGLEISLEDVCIDCTAVKQKPEDVPG